MSQCVLLLSLILGPCLAATPLTFRHHHARARLHLPYGHTANYSLPSNLSASASTTVPSALVVQFTPSDPVLNHTLRHGLPDLLLYALSHPALPVVSNACDPALVDCPVCNCSVFYPCFSQRPDVFVDTLSFFAHRQYAFLTIPDLTLFNASFQITVHNYPRNRVNIHDNNRTLRPVLLGHLDVRVVPDDHPDLLPIHNHTLPSLPFQPRHLCGPFGQCRNATCVCNLLSLRDNSTADAMGVACQYPTFTWPTDTSPFPNRTVPLPVPVGFQDGPYMEVNSTTDDYPHCQSTCLQNRCHSSPRVSKPNP